MKKIFGFIFADDCEFKPFADFAISKGGHLVTNNPQNVIELDMKDYVIYAIESGIGKVNSAVAAIELIKTYNVTAIMSAGLSGAISELRCGDIVAGESYVECDFDIRPFGYPLGKKPDGGYIYQVDQDLIAAAKKIEGMKVGALGTGDFFLTDAAKKKEYSDEFGVKAFDMESGAIAAACNRYQIPFMSIRKISDDADDAATESYREMNNLCEVALTEILMEVVSNLI